MTAPLPMTSLTLPAPAKLNLFLHITGQRADGFHELETLFQFITFADTMHFELTEHGKVELTTPFADVPPAENLIVRAANLLLPHRQQSQLGVRISIDKVLPMGGGLGGGSSNAATVLLALNQLWQLNLPLTELAKLGLQLGADVPVFVNGHAAFARGVGEQLFPAAPAEDWYLIIIPEVSVATGDVFQHPDLPRNTPPLENIHSPWQQQRNDCQSLVSATHPQVAKAINRLLEYAPTRMTGTGACVFATFKTKAEAEQVLKKIASEFRGVVAQGQNVSPAWQHLHRSLIYS